MEKQPQQQNRRLSKEVKDMLQSEIASARSRRSCPADDDSPLDKVDMNRSALPSKFGNEDSVLDSENSPVKDSKDRLKLIHPSNKVSPFDIHNSFYTEAEQPVEWAFREEELPNFPTQSNTLRVLIVTWNLHGKRPKEGLDQLFNIDTVKHHIISVGTEECLRSIPASTFYESKSYWVNMLRKHLDKDYIMIKSHSMNALHLTLFAHRNIFKHIKGIESSEVKTGLANIIGNKGGIGITFQICGTSLLFINCHLASGQSQVKRRTEDFKKIMNNLELPKNRIAQEKKLKQKSKIVDRFDCVFWSGDFNYRVNQTRENTIKFLKEKNFETLIQDDQMMIEKQRNEIFQDFKEGDIKFLPTYKYQVGTQLFDNKKMRTPSWTDRILYTCIKDQSKIIQMNYQTFQSITTSDHRPIFSQFMVKCENPEKETDDGGAVKMKSSHCNIF